MFKIKLLILLCASLLLGACSLIGKKDKKNTPIEEPDETTLFEEPGEEIAADPIYIETEEDSITFNDYANNESDTTSDTITDVSSLFSSFDTDTPGLNTNDEKLSVYQNVIQDMQDEITKLKSELDRNTEELYKLKAQSQIWNNPFSIYNKEIILTNGSTVYGKIKYQDQDVLHVETLIGELTIQRNTVKRVVENITQAPDSIETEDQTRRNEILEIKRDEDNTIFKPTTKLLANSILLGDIIEEVDFRGNRTLRGDIKNIGEARADFVKINFVFRMNWQGSTKSLTAFVQGSKYVFSDSNIESDSSIEVGAVAGFELVIPPDFGQFIGYSYSIDWEQYDN